MSESNIITSIHRTKGNSDHMQNIRGFRATRNGKVNWDVSKELCLAGEMESRYLKPHLSLHQDECVSLRYLAANLPLCLSGIFATPPASGQSFAIMQSLEYHTASLQSFLTSPLLSMRPSSTPVCTECFDLVAPARPLLPRRLLSWIEIR